jgi:hypothetical protein
MGPLFGHPRFVLSGPKDVSTGSRLRAKWGTPILAPIVNGDDGPEMDLRAQQGGGAAVGARHGRPHRAEARR